MKLRGFCSLQKKTIQNALLSWEKQGEMRYLHIGQRRCCTMITVQQRRGERDKGR